jgi:catechol 2,3-dioxygenase-like lactoylglutathione lyase family enzyme
VPNALHHIALRVSDIERAAAFFVGVFSAERVVLPFVTRGAVAETITGGPPGVSFVSCMLRIGADHLELFEFRNPIHAMEPAHPTRGNILHISIQVDDVEATLTRAETLGGRRLWTSIERWGSAQAIYLSDPDGNVIELIDTAMDEIVRMTHGMFPDTDPAAGHARA